MSKYKKSDAHLLDIDALVKSVINSGLSPDVFDVEVDIPRAKNVIDFALGPTFLNTENLYAKQMEQAVKLFAEYCPECSKTEYINDVPTLDPMYTFLENVQLLEFSVCPKCKKNKKELFPIYPNELVSCLGQRSGKTALAGGVIFPYILHRFLKLANPTRYLGLMPNTMLQITMVAVSATQAYETLWLATSSTITSAPWFKEYHKALKEEEKAKSLSPGTLVKVLDTFIWYGNKKISITYQAADMKTLRGRTRIAAGIDELAWFNNNNYKEVIRANPEETYTALDNSLRTVRNATDKLWAQGDYDVPTAYMLNISSPRSQYDKMMRLLKQAETDKRKAAFHYASWEASPNMPREQLKSIETNTPVIFWRDFGAQPPLADCPFISNKNAIYKTKSNNTPLFTTKPIYVNDKAGTGKFKAAEIISCDTDKQTARVITCDAGESGNCFAISLHHIEQVDTEVSLVLDGTVSVMPERIPEQDITISIHFPTMFEIILSLCKNFNIKYVVYDRWQCVTGDTLTYTTEGIKKIKDLHEDVYGVFNTEINIADINGINKTSKWGKLKDREIVEVTTKNCYSIKGTPEHKLLTIGPDSKIVWRKIQDLQESDWLALKQPNVWSQNYYKINTNVIPTEGKIPKYVDTNLAKVLGYLSSESGCGSVLYSYNPEVAENYIQAFNKVFGYLPVKLLEGKLIPWGIYACDTAIIDFLYEVGMDLPIERREVPKCILESPKEVVVSYLQTLFEVNGSFSKHRKSILFKSTSLQLIKQVQAILINFGIYTGNVTKKERKNSKSYTLALKGSNAINFYNEIGSVTKRENTLFKKLQNKEILPIAKLVQNWLTDFPGIRRKYNLYYLCTKKVISKKIYVTKLRDLMLETDPDLVELIDTLVPFYWTTIKSKEDAGREDVYDVTVPGTSSFIANGIVSHNSTGEIQRLRDLKITAEKYSPKFQDFIELRNLIEGENYKTPRWEYENLEDLDITDHKKLGNSPYTHLALQMATVRENGKKVLKPEEGDDDMFRTVVLASKYLIQHKEILLKAGLAQAVRSRSSLGVVIGKTSGGMSGYRPTSGGSVNVGVIRRKSQ